MAKRIGLFCVLGVVGLLCIKAFTQPEQKQLTIYTAQTTYSLPVTDRNGNEYVGLAELLEPLGAVSAKLDGNKWKLNFAGREAQFQVGKTKARINKREMELVAPFAAENSRGQVPLRNVPAVLAQIAPEHPAMLREQARRLFLDKTEVRYTAELRKSTPEQLVLSFSAPVNPQIATEAGKLRMTFRREPLLATGAETVNFDDKDIPSLAFSEANGAAQLTVTGTASLMASFSPDRRTITISLPVAVAQAPQPIPPLPTTTAQPPPAAPPAPRFLVVIDPAHGGNDAGGTIAEELAEKDVTLAFARHLRKELEARGAAVRLLRDGDTALTADQRAVLTNGSTPSLYLAVHAAGSGSGVRVFTARIAPAQRVAAFLPWDTAQAAYVLKSRDVASVMVTELLKHDVSGAALRASVRPLGNVAAPAIAVEIAAPAGASSADVNTARYQQSLSAAIATAIINERGKLPHGGAAR